MSDWIEWKGRSCPVTENTGVDIKLGTGLIAENVRAGNYDWEHCQRSKRLNAGICGDIVAYRIHGAATPVTDEVRAKAWAELVRITSPAVWHKAEDLEKQVFWFFKGYASTIHAALSQPDEVKVWQRIVVDLATELTGYMAYSAIQYQTDPNVSALEKHAAKIDEARKELGNG